MINRIKIENFKSIREMDLELLPVNVLIGSNGAGKSNFISFFGLLKNMYDKQLGTYTLSEGGAGNILYFGLKKSEYLNGDIEFEKRNAYYFELKNNREGTFFFNREGTRFNRDWYNAGWDDVPLNHPHTESLLADQTEVRYKYVKNYMESFKIFHFHDTGKNSRIKQKGDINDNADLREDGGNLAAYLYLLKEKYPTHFKKIEMVVRSVAPFFDKFKLEPDRINEQLIWLEWKEKGSEEYFNVTHLSDGTLRFIALATLLLQPESPKTIIIDEPELGLHPFAIGKLAGLIQKASAKSQMIISTQSVNLVDHFLPEDIITVDRKNNQSVFERKSAENLEGWLDEYNHSMGELWTKNVIGGRP